MLPKIKSLALVCMLLAFSANTLLAQIIAHAGSDTTICAGSNVILGGHPIASGGTPPYTYIWSPSTGLSSATSANPLDTPGTSTTYTLIVTDANNFSSSASVTVTVNPLPKIDSVVVKNVSCNGGVDGRTCVYGSGNIIPPYLWSNGETSQCATNLTAGVYNVTVFNSFGCSATASATVSQPPVLSNSLNTSSVSCYGGSNGSACNSATGGTTPYTYLWSNGATAACVTNSLAPTSYATTVTDAYGCSATASATISQPVSPIHDSLVVTNDACYGVNNGTITEHLTGGTPGYTFIWSNGENTATATSLGPGAYTVTATDALGCTATATGIVTQPARLNLQINTSGAHVLPDTARLLITGGAPPYRINWGTGHGTDTDSTASNIYSTKGAYGITIIDTNNCIMAYTLYVDSTVPIIINAGHDTSICAGGSLKLGGNPTVSGGTPPYSYAWSGGGFNTSNPDVTPVTGVTIYTVTVTDAASASSTASVTVTALAAPTSSFTATSAVCAGQNSTITYTGNASAGSTYTWNFDGGNSTPDTGRGPILANWNNAGTYTIGLVVIQSGCSSILTSAHVTVTAFPTSTFTVTSPFCLGGSSVLTYRGTAGNNATFSWGFDSAMVIAGTGSGPYDLTWNTAGIKIITLSVTDNGCSSQQGVENVVVLPLPALTVSSDTAICEGQNVTLTASGANTYSWAPSLGLSSANTARVVASPPVNTNYTVIGSNSNCSASASITVSVNQFSDSLSVTNVSCYGGSNGGVCTYVTTGLAPFSYAWSNGATQQCITNLAAGIYSLTLSDAHGCQLTDSAGINTPPRLYLTDSVNNVSCFDSTDGVIIITPDGGTPGYTYTWSNGATSQNLANLGNGTFVVTVSDASGCTTSASGTINEPSQVTVSIIATNDLCFGGSNGTVTANASGGIQPYAFLWNSVDTGATVTGLTAGVYQLAMADAHGCVATDSITIIQPTQLTLQVFTPDTNAVPDSVSFNVTGGTPPYFYSWGNGQTSSSGQYVYTTGGVYLDSISDANGCVVTYLIDAGCSDQCVWPGDANYDGIVNNNDLLSIGIGYDSTGPARTNPSINFIPQYCTQWADTLIGGINYKHVDCNGNGIINADDTMAIVLNYSLTHVRGGGGNSWKADAPGLYLTSSTDTIGDNQVLINTLSLGNTTLPANDAYAVAFTYNFDPLVVDTASVHLDFINNSWLFNPGNHINITKNFLRNGQIQAAITRTNHLGLTGNGAIATVSMKITTGNINGKNLQYYTMHNFISDLTVIDSVGNTMAVNAGYDSVVIGFNPTSVFQVKNTNSRIQIYPNPVSEQLNILSAQSDIEEITIFDLAGQQVIHQSMQAGNYSVINVSELSDGVYIIKLKTQGAEYHSRFIKGGTK